MEALKYRKSFLSRGMQYIQVGSSGAMHNRLTVEENLTFLGQFFGQRSLAFAPFKYFSFLPDVMGEKCKNIPEAERVLLELSPLFLSGAKLWIISKLPSKEVLGTQVYQRIAHLVNSKVLDGKGIVLYTTTDNKPLGFQDEVIFCPDKE